MRRGKSWTLAKGGKSSAWGAGSTAPPGGALALGSPFLRRFYHFLEVGLGAKHFVIGEIQRAQRREVRVIME